MVVAVWALSLATFEVNTNGQPVQREEDSCLVKAVISKLNLNDNLFNSKDTTVTKPNPFVAEPHRGKKNES